MILIVNLFLITGLLILGRRWTKGSVLGGYYWPTVLLKILMGGILGLVYLYVYQGGDTFSFFEAAVIFKNLALTSWDNFVSLYGQSDYRLFVDFPYAWWPSAFFVKLLAVFAWLTHDNYWLSGTYLSLISFSGIWMWAKQLHRISEDKLLALVAGLLIPSILFWSSGVMKEAVVIPTLAGLMSFFVKYYLGDRLNWRHFIIITALLIILAIMKYFLVAALLAVAPALLLTRKLVGKETHWLRQFLVLKVIILLLAGLVSLLHPNLWPSRMAEVIFSNYQAYLQAYDSQGVIIYPNLAPTLLSMAIHLPKAIFAGLFLPLWPIEGSRLSYFSVVENWFLIIASIATVFSLFISWTSTNKLLVMGGLLFVFLTAGFIALSTPNLGTLARYKTSYLLVFAPIVMSGLFNLYRNFLR